MMITTLPSESTMYEALCGRDAAFTGVFVFAVRTTGVFCRPTCTSRRPNRENVEYFSTASEAMHAGYRPCKRCHPEEVIPAPAAEIAALVQEVDGDPARRVGDADLRRRGLDPARIRRGFKRHYGMTFHAYQRARRMGAALSDIRAGRDVLDAGQRSGFDSASGFHDAFVRILGTTPGRARDGRVDYLAAKWIDTPLGAMIAVADDDDGLLLLEFVDRRGLERELQGLRKRRAAEVLPGCNEHLTQIESELATYFAGDLRAFETKITLIGSPFQQQIWEELIRIPYGQTRSYAEMAERIGRAGAQRPVGRANGMNQLSIIVPCHRVVGSNGQLTGYGGGLWRKQRLLDLEQDTTDTRRSCR